MKFGLNFVFFICIIFAVFSCKSVIQNSPKFDFNYQNNWKYFTFKDTLTVKVINNISSNDLCGNIAVGSVIIGISKNDTIRVIELCKKTDYKIGSIVRFLPAEKPDFNVSLPHTYNSYYIKKKKIITPGFFELHILKTTYGNAINNL